MTMRMPWAYSVAFLALIYPLMPVLDWATEALTGAPLQLERQLLSMMIFALLTLALSLQVGQAGIVQLGLAAFFALGAFGAGILTVQKYPIQLGFWGALVLVPPLCAAVGACLSAPCANLRGDYLAMVTLAFGELTRVILLNTEGITDGSRGLNPLPVPWLPESLVGHLDGPARQHVEFLTIYYVALWAVLTTVVVLTRVLGQPLGRAFVALREDELACASLGLNPGRLRLVAFASGAGLAGLAGVLYATYLTTTAEPSTYDFNLSTMVLCAAILGGLDSPRGAVLGAVVLTGFDNLLAPSVTAVLKALGAGDDPGPWASFASWRLLIFGGALVALMRLRPEGLWPAHKTGRAKAITS
jgi:branched-chain amino acid transport system permease protein